MEFTIYNNKKISLENINCAVIVILLYQKSDEPVSITGVLDGQIIITLSIFYFVKDLHQFRKWFEHN